MIVIGDTIKKLRNQRNISQKTMSGKLNVSCQTISKWETGKAYPDITIIPRIADFFHITIDTLFNGIIEDYGDALTDSKKVHLQENHMGWNKCAETNWTGGTILPNYGPYTPTEDQLNLFDDLQDKSVLELACGDGKSLLYMAGKGVKELYGLDLSDTQIEQARENLLRQKVDAQLYISPMEVNPGIPFHHFDCVYSIYGIGWTLDIDKVFSLVSKYLKTNGIFIFSWDNPLLQCIESQNGNYVINKSYVKESSKHITKFGKQMYLKNWKLSTYMNALINNGFEIERFIEESDNYAENAVYMEKYYSEHKANYLNHSIIIKARKK